MTRIADLDIRLDPWDVEYGTELPFDAAPPEAREGEGVDTTVEVPGAWEPIVPPARGVALGSVAFVDGVRRIDARLIVRKGDRIVHGALGSFAVGAVLVKDGEACWGPETVGRIAATGSGVLISEPLRVAPRLAYLPAQPARATTADAPLLVLQHQMRACEARVAAEIAREGRLVVCDGPLSFEASAHGRALGYVKRLFELYLPPDRLAVLPKLPVGGRTPLFRLRASQGSARYAWFLRLARPGPGESDLAGLVRLEMADAAPVDEARALADATATSLPAFAPRHGRDPRAPQNLLPIGALESRLRRLLGDPRAVRRHIQTYLAEGAAPSEGARDG